MAIRGSVAEKRTVDELQLWVAAIHPDKYLKPPAPDQWIFSDGSRLPQTFADHPGPQAVDQCFGRQQPVVDLNRVTARTMRCDDETLSREISEVVGHVGMALQLLAQHPSHYPGRLSPASICGCFRRWKADDARISSCVTVFHGPRYMNIPHGRGCVWKAI